MYTYFRVFGEHASLHVSVPYNWIRQVVEQAQEIFENYPDVNSVIYNCWCDVLDDELERDCGFVENLVVTSSQCGDLLVCGDYFQIELDELRSLTYSLPEADESLRKHALEILEPKVEKLIEEGALPRHALREVIYDALSDEDTRAWHEGDTTILVEAALDLLAKYGYSELQIYGVKKPIEDESSLEVIIAG